MRNTSRSREKISGQVGRYRVHRCRNCGQVFDRFLLRALPEKAKICTSCLEQPELRRQYDEAFEERDRKEEVN